MDDKKKDLDLMEDLLGVSLDKQETYAESQWKGMPEYTHIDMTSDTHIVMHFRNDADREAFSKLIDQPITTKTKTLWYPMLETRHFEDKRYVTDES